MSCGWRWAGKKTPTAGRFRLAQTEGGACVESVKSEAEQSVEINKERRSNNNSPESGLMHH